MRATSGSDGLSNEGVILIQELMRLGMLIDIDHMSEIAVNQTLDMATQLAQRTTVKYYASDPQKFQLGDILLQRNRTGNREFDINADGVAPSELA